MSNFIFYFLIFSYIFIYFTSRYQLKKIIADFSLAIISQRDGLKQTNIVTYVDNANNFFLFKEHPLIDEKSNSRNINTGYIFPISLSTINFINNDTKIHLDDFDFEKFIHFLRIESFLSFLFSPLTLCFWVLVFSIRLTGFITFKFIKTDFLKMMFGV